MKKTIFTAMLLASLFFGSSGSADAQIFVGGADPGAGGSRYRAADSIRSRWSLCNQ